MSPIASIHPIKLMHQILIPQLINLVVQSLILAHKQLKMSPPSLIKLLHHLQIFNIYPLMDSMV